MTIEPVLYADLERRIAKIWAFGLDSLEIAHLVVLPEADVCRILNRQREARRSIRAARLEQRITA